MARLTTMATMPASAALASGDASMSLSGTGPARLGLGTTTAEEIPEPTGLLMQIGEHLA